MDNVYSKRLNLVSVWFHWGVDLSQYEIYKIRKLDARYTSHRNSTKKLHYFNFLFVCGYLSFDTFIQNICKVKDRGKTTFGQRLTAIFRQAGAHV